MKEGLYLLLHLVFACDAIFFGGDPESPFADGDCDPPFTTCVDDSECSWMGGRSGTGEGNEIDTDLSVELLSNRCNTRKTCCPKAPNYFCEPGFDLTFDRSVCGYLYVEPAYSARPAPAYGAPAQARDGAHAHGAPGHAHGAQGHGHGAPAHAHGAPAQAHGAPAHAAPAPAYGAPAPRPSYGPPQPPPLPYPVPCCDGRPFMCEEEECSRPSYGDPGPQVQLFSSGFCDGPDGERIPAPCCGTPRPEYKPSYEATRRRSNGRRARRSSATGAGSFVKPPRRRVRFG